MLRSESEGDVNTNPPPSPEFTKLLLQANATEFPEPAYSGPLADRVLGLSGELPSGASIFTFCPAALGPTPDLDRLLLFFIRELHNCVQNNEAGYCMVFCQSGSSSFRGIGMSFLRRVYKLLGRRFKKNIRNLLILHPTNALKTLFFFARPFISTKFWKKVMYYNHHKEIASSPALQGATFYPGAAGRNGTFILPVHSLSIDDNLPITGTWATRPYPVRFIGCSTATELQNRYGVPDFLSTCYQLLQKDLTTDGLFRISADAEVLGSLLRQFENHGVTSNTTRSIFTWHQNSNGNADSTDKMPHIISALLKKYLRETPAPMFPNRTYKPLLHLFSSAENSSSSDATMNAMLNEGITSLLSQMLNNKETCNLFTFLKFLQMVSNTNGNRMDANNIAVVFAPNVLRPPLPPPPSAHSFPPPPQPMADVKVILTETQNTIKLLKWLITNVDVLFKVKRDDELIKPSNSENQSFSNTLWYIDTDDMGIMSSSNKTRPNQLEISYHTTGPEFGDFGEETKEETVRDERRSGGNYNQEVQSDDFAAMRLKAIADAEARLDLMEAEEQVEKDAETKKVTDAAADFAAMRLKAIADAETQLNLMEAEEAAEAENAAKTTIESTEIEKIKDTEEVEDAIQQINLAMQGGKGEREEEEAAAVEEAEEAIDSTDIKIESNQKEKEQKFFATSKAEKEKQEQINQEEEQKKRNAMSPDDLAALVQKEEEQKLHDKQKDKALKQMAGSYGSKKKNKKKKKKKGRGGK